MLCYVEMALEPFEKRSGDRRKFFRALLNRVVEPMAETMERPLERFDQLVNPPPPPPPPTPWRPTLLRPPGAQTENDFLTICSRSARCVDICPVQAIKVYQSDDPQLSGTPYIDPELQACVLCKDVPCATACPSGALTPIAVESVRIGLAEWAQELCLRTMGQECNTCIEKCPVGERAIGVHADTYIEVKADGCTGCGVCQSHCPVYPKAIVVKPL